MTVRVKVMQEDQIANLRAFTGLKPRDSQRAILYATAEAHRYLVSITHVRTGAYRAAQRMKVENVQGQLYVDPDARNKYGQMPAEYSLYEEELGGSHAAYQRTVEEAGPRIEQRASEMIAQEVLYGR